MCKFLHKSGYLNRINNIPVSKKQLRFEIKYSIQSIIIFGCSVIPIVYLIRTEIIKLSEYTLGRVLLGLVILTIWNEVHFFFVHRLMHTPYFMRKVHHIHHQSKTPTVFAVYSFHWVEAALLSTVPITILPFLSLPAITLFLYPLLSILLNFAGHCNYRFGNGKKPNWALFGTKHFNHHYQFSTSYSFASGLMDRLFTKKTTKIN